MLFRLDRFDVPLFALIRRELIGELRTVRSFLLLVGAMGLLIAYVAVFFPEFMRGFAASAGMGGRLLYMQYISFLYLFAMLAIPALAAGSISSERKNATLEQLYLTLLTPREIMLGKTLGIVLFYGLIVIATLPAAGVLFFLVGVDWYQFFTSLAICTFCAIAATLIGLHASSRGFGWFRTVIMALFYVFIFMVAIPGFLAAIFENPGIFPLYAASGRVFGSPLFSLALCLGYLLVLTFLLAKVITRKLASVLEADWSGPRLDNVLFSEVDLTGGAFARAFKKKAPATAGDAEQRTARGARWMPAGCLVALYLGFIAALMLIAAVAGEDTRDTDWIGWPVIQLAVLMTIVPGIASAQVSREYDEGAMDMLRLTLLRSHSIVLAQFVKSFLSVLPFLAAMLIGMLPLFLRTSGQDTRVWMVLAVYVEMLLSTFAGIALAQVGALLTRSPSRATLFGYALCGMGLLAVPLVCIMLENESLAETILPMMSLFNRETNLFIPVHFFYLVVETAGLLFLSSVLFERFHMRRR